MERVIRLRTRDKRYIKSTSYPFVPAQRGINGIYLTGQIVDPSDPKTKNFLTLDEATGVKQISDEKLKLFPFIINPFDILPLVNNMKLQVGISEDGTPINYQDYAIWKMLLLNDHLIAATETSYNLRKHVFYFEDVIALAEEKTTSKRKETLVMSNIFNQSPSKQRELMLLLNIYDTRFKENPDNLSSVLVEDKIVKAVEKNVNILDGVFEKDGSFSKKANEDLMIAKLVHLGEIRINISEFYYKNTYMGNDVDTVKKWMRDKANQDVMNKWSALLSKTNGIPSVNAVMDNKDNVETFNPKAPIKTPAKKIEIEDELPEITSKPV